MIPESCNNFEPQDWRGSEAIQRARVLNWIGVDTPTELHPFLSNLAHFIQYGTKSIPTPIRYSNFTIVENHRITNQDVKTPGGPWSCSFWSLFVESNKREAKRVYVSVWGTEKIIKDPRSGNRKGTTKLIIATEDLNKKRSLHNSLQLNLDKFVSVSEDYYSIAHNGRKSGQRSKDILNHIYLHSPQLVKQIDSKRIVILGTLDNSHNIAWQQEGTRSFVGNLIEYALLRDECHS